MKTVCSVLKQIDPSECIEVLVSLHRLYYFQPGYLLNSTLIYKKYENLYNQIVSSPCKAHEPLNIKMVYDGQEQVYNLFVHPSGKLLREFSPGTNPEESIEIVAAATLTYPKNVTKEAVAVELLYEISYYDFKETS